MATGRAGVQDEGSQLVATALATAPLDGYDTKWLDLCAGPGGKSALLAALVHQRDGELTAVEPLKHRADLVRANLRAIPGDHKVLVGDGTKPTWPAGSFDRVLADVPCSGLGALRRRPEARWRRTPEDVVELRPLQEDLLDSAITSVRPGGVVAYVTCSPHPDETRAVVDAVLGKRDDAVLEDARALFPGVPDARRRSRRPAVAASARHRRDVPGADPAVIVVDLLSGARRRNGHDGGVTTTATRPARSARQHQLVGPERRLRHRDAGRGPVPAQRRTRSRPRRRRRGRADLVRHRPADPADRYGAGPADPPVTRQRLAGDPDADARSRRAALVAVPRGSSAAPSWSRPSRSLCP